MLAKQLEGVPGKASKLQFGRTVPQTDTKQLQFTADILNEHLNRTAYQVIDGKLTNDSADFEVTFDGNEYTLTTKGEVIRFRNYVPVLLADDLLRDFIKH